MRMTLKKRVIWTSLVIGCVWYGWLRLGLHRTSLDNLYRRISPTIVNFVLEEDEPQASHYQERLERYREVCSARQDQVHSYHYGYVYKDPSHNVTLSYCIVPKAGCTFWAKIFIFLNTHEIYEKGNPFDITRFQVHNPKSIKHKMRHKLEESVDFFFVRNPYSRLMSAYVDKIVLPQNLQEDIVDKFFGQQSTNTYRCLNKEISFPDFINKIVFGVGSNNPHWTPIHTSCDPCKIIPRFIGKQETFLKDANFLLNSIGLGHLMKHYSQTFYYEVTDLVDFVFNMHGTAEHIRRCFNRTDLAARLWLAFQYNGYLPLKFEFPRDEFETLFNDLYNISDAKDVVAYYILDAIGQTGPPEDRTAQQRRINMVSLYASLSRVTMEKIADLFDEDFKMYGYEKYPKDLYPWK